MKTVLNFILIISTWSGTLAAQTLTYDVFVAGRKSGTLIVKADKTDSNNFYIHSEFNITVAFSDAYSKSEVYFKNGHLQKSTLIQKVNDKEREKTDISYNGTHYRIQRKGEVASDLKNSILYSIAMLYHTEPEGKKNVFSERYGKFFDIKKIDANRYELALPDGKKTFYTYENGICTRVQTKQMLMDVRFELLN